MPSQEPLTTEKVANDVKERVDKNDLKGAYDTLNREAHELFKSTDDQQKKDDIWMLLSNRLQDNGTLPKVAAEWMNQNGCQIGGNNQNVEKSELDGIAKNAKDPLWKGLAAESSKNFAEAAKLGDHDQSLNANERKHFAARQAMPSREDHVEKSINGLLKDLGNNDKNAFLKFYGETSKRYPLETAEERVDTWNAMQDGLRNKGLMGGFVSFWQNLYKDQIDGNKNGGNGNGIVEYNEVVNLQKSPSPTTAAVGRYIAENPVEFRQIDFRPKPQGGSDVQPQPQPTDVKQK